MKRKRTSEYNILNLALGLLLGFFIGGGIAYLNFNRQNDSFFYKYFQELYEKAQSTFLPKYSNEYLVRKNENKINDKKDSIETGKKNVNSGSEISYIHIENDIRASIDSVSQIHRDSVFEAISENTDSSGFYENITLLTDKLISTKAIVLDFERASISDATRELDSLLGNVPDRRKVPDNLYYIEFYESPINFQGYKMSKNRIMLYGLNSINAATFKVLKNEIYLNYLDDYYLLKESNDFLPLRPISETYIINQLENK